MANTTFYDGVTPIFSDWLNAVNNFVYGTNVNKQNYQTATNNQTLFTVGFSYTVGANSILVFVNGSKQIKTLNYTETSTSTVTFSTGLNAGDVVEFVFIQ